MALTGKSWHGSWVHEHRLSFSAHNVMPAKRLTPVVQLTEQSSQPTP